VGQGPPFDYFEDDDRDSAYLELPYLLSTVQSVCEPTTSQALVH
jgi:hypothetical protein